MTLTVARGPPAGAMTGGWLRGELARMAGLRDHVANDPLDHRAGLLPGRALHARRGRLRGRELGGTGPADEPRQLCREVERGGLRVGDVLVVEHDAVVVGVV